MKVCNKCGEFKELSEFHKDNQSKSGFKNRCKFCKKEEKNDNMIYTL